MKPTILKGPVIVLAGGPAPESEDAEQEKNEQAIQTPETIEPVLWHCPPAQLQEEWVHCHNLASICDLTPADGARAMAAIRERIPYCGIAFNQAHVDHLYDHLYRETLKAYLREARSMCKRIVQHNQFWPRAGQSDWPAGRPTKFSSQI